MINIFAILAMLINPFAMKSKTFTNAPDSDAISFLANGVDKPSVEGASIFKMEEIWKDILGYEGIYMVSNIGRVKSLDRYIDHPITKKTLLKGVMREIDINSDGYPLIRLCKNGMSVSRSVHRYVAEAFIPNPLNLPEVNHKNGVKTDNSVENLEWVTRSENQLHAYATGLKKPPTTNHTVCRGITATSLYDPTVIVNYNSINEVVGAGFSRICVYASISKRIRWHKGFVWSYSNAEFKYRSEKSQPAKWAGIPIIAPTPKKEVAPIPDYLKISDPALLVGNQKIIYETLPNADGEYVSSTKIGERLGVTSNMVSTYLDRILKKTTLINMIQKGRKKYWRKATIISA